MCGEGVIGSEALIGKIAFMVFSGVLLMATALCLISCQNSPFVEATPIPPKESLTLARPMPPSPVLRSTAALTSTPTLTATPTLTPTPTLRPTATPIFAPSEATWRYVLRKIEENAAQLGDEFPFFTVDGRWETVADGGWVGGFWPGILWLAYERTGDIRYKEWALKWTHLLAPRQHDTGTHDIGVIFYTSYVAGYRITGEKALRDVALTAADSLLRRFNERGGFIQAWGPIGDEKLAGRTIVDTMIVLPLLWWAHDETGEARYYHAAFEHALTTMRVHVRPDGSTAHVAELDPRTGALLRQTTHQGYSDSSCWSRGQAWGIYGFAIAYREAGREDFLETAEKLADYFIAHLPEDYVPYWDFQAPNIPHEVKDSSAAAIAASGLLELASLELDGEKAESYEDAALKILRSLTENYLTKGEPSRAGLLLHGCYNKPGGVAVDSSLIWGDYFYVESLTKIERALAHTVEKQLN